MGFRIRALRHADKHLAEGQGPRSEACSACHYCYRGASWGLLLDRSSHCHIAQWGGSQAVTPSWCPLTSCGFRRSQGSRKPIAALHKGHPPSALGPGAGWRLVQPRSSCRFSSISCLSPASFMPTGSQKRGRGRRRRSETGAPEILQTLTTALWGRCFLIAIRQTM